MKPSFSTIPVTVAEERYHVIVRKFPGRKQPHVGFDSPRYLDPGAPARVQVLRILRGAVDVTDDLTYFTRQSITRAAIKLGGGR